LPSQFNTLVQGLSIASMTPQQILAAGSPIFLDIRTASDINSINTLIQSYARIHSPAYGQPIAGSGTNHTKIGTGTILAPDVNEVARVMGINFYNSGVAPVILEYGLNGVLLQTNITVNPNETVVGSPPCQIFSDSESHLYITVISGNEADLLTSCTTILTSQ
jgi:hypothetical protein